MTDILLSSFSRYTLWYFFICFFFFVRRNRFENSILQFINKNLNSAPIMTVAYGFDWMLTSGPWALCSVIILKRQVLWYVQQIQWLIICLMRDDAWGKPGLIAKHLKCNGESPIQSMRLMIVCRWRCEFTPEHFRECLAVSRRSFEGGRSSWILPDNNKRECLCH